jgi:hypothetical protein
VRESARARLRACLRACVLCASVRYVCVAERLGKCGDDLAHLHLHVCLSVCLSISVFVCASASVSVSVCVRATGEASNTEDMVPLAALKPTTYP